MNARLYLLGTGAAMPIARSLPCIALKVDSDIYLFDVGEGCQVKMFKKGLSPLKVKAIFITHGHGDHYLGLPGLIQTMVLSDRKEQLYIAVPRSLKEPLLSLFKYGLMKTGFRIEFLEVVEGFTYNDKKIAVKAYPVNHTIESYGYHVTIGRKTLCYTGDTAPCKTIVENCKNVDVLIHDATFTSLLEEEAHEQGHSTAYDAARVANEASAKMLVLFHVSARYAADEVFFDAYRLFKNTIVAKDGLILIL